MGTVSINTAIQRGLAMVYGPFFLFVVGIPIAIYALAAQFNIPAIIALFSVPTGIIVAWVWWSFRVPQWRVWALQHVDDIENLHRRAVQVGIEWPYGHLFKRTEIKSHQLALQEASLQLQYYLQRTIKEARLIDETHSNNEITNIINTIQQYNLDQTPSIVATKALKHDIQEFLQRQTIQKTGFTKYQSFVMAEYFLNKYQHLKEKQ